MNMVIYMITAKTMVAIAAGTVAELQIGTVGVSFTAHGAFMPIRRFFLFLLYSSCLGFKLDSSRRNAFAEDAQISQQLLAADDEKVEQRYERKESQKCISSSSYNVTYDRVCEICRVYQRQPFDFKGNRQKQSDIFIRKEYRVSKKHGKIEIFGREIVVWYA